MFPDDPTLIARGKHATLSRERRQQIERVAGICKTVMHLANPILDDCQEKPPTNAKPLDELETCLTNLKAARERIVTLCLGMEELREEAWG